MTSTNLYQKIQCDYDNYCELNNEPPKEIVFTRKAVEEFFNNIIPEKLYGMTVSITDREKEEYYYIKVSTTF